MPPVRKTAPSKDRPLIWFGKYLSLALTLPACVAAGYILGAVVHHWVNSPLTLVAGLLLGMVAGILQVVRELSRDSRKA